MFVIFQKKNFVLLGLLCLLKCGKMQICPNANQPAVGNCFSGNSCGDSAQCNIRINLCCPQSGAGNAGPSSGWRPGGMPFCRDGVTRAAAMCFENYRCGQAHKYECIDGLCCKRNIPATSPWTVFTMRTTVPTISGVTVTGPGTGTPPTPTIATIPTVAPTNTTTNGTAG